MAKVADKDQVGPFGRVPRLERHPARPKAKSRGGKLGRSETVTVKLDPKLRYFAELAARKQRRTVSSFIEWAIEESLKQIQLSEGGTEGGLSHFSWATELWDVDEADRFAKLAFRFPYMLTHDEQMLWKLVRENGFFWWRNADNGTWDIEEEWFHFDRLREHWTTLWEVVRGIADKAILPRLE